jgi:hypothetical protein
MIALAVVLTVMFGSGQNARADNTFGGAGETITQSKAPTAIETPSAAPVVKATAYGSG